MKNYIKITSLILILIAICLSLNFKNINAYFIDNETLSSELVFGTVETEIIEDNDTKIIVPGEDFKKVVKVKNIGESPCFVRVKVLISPEKYKDTLSLNINTNDWEYKNGYYYYKNTLNSGNETTPLFTKLTIPNDLETGDIFDINIYSESIQSIIYENGTVIKDYKEIFEKL